MNACEELTRVKQLIERVGLLWSAATAVVPAGLTWALASLFVSPTLRNYAIGATVVASIIGFLLAASGTQEWTDREKRGYAFRSLLLFLTAALGCGFFLTALRADVAAIYQILQSANRFLVVATPFSNFLIALVWGLGIGSLVFTLVVLSPKPPERPAVPAGTV